MEASRWRAAAGGCSPWLLALPAGAGALEEAWTHDVDVSVGFSTADADLIVAGQTSTQLFLAVTVRP